MGKGRKTQDVIVKWGYRVVPNRERGRVPTCDARQMRAIAASGEGSCTGPAACEADTTNGKRVCRAEAGISGCRVSAMDKGGELGMCPGAHSGGGEGNEADEECSKALNRALGALCCARQ